MCILSLQIWVYILDEQARFQFLLQLCDLYENDSIFDKFDCCPSGDGLRVATGSYRLQIFPLLPLEKWINQGLWSDTVFSAAVTFFVSLDLYLVAMRLLHWNLASILLSEWSVFDLIFHVEILYLMNTSWFSVGRRFLQTPAKTSRSLTSFGRRGKKGMLSRVFINVKYIPSISHCLKAWALLSPDIRNYNWPIPSWPSALCVHKVSN